MDPTRLVVLLMFVLVMILFANSKGFNPLLWIFSGGFLGLIVLACLPSAKVSDIDDEEKQRRKQKGNTVGAMISIAILTVVLVLITLTIFF